MPPSLVLPERVVIRLVTEVNALRRAVSLPGIAVSIDVLQCTKNPYRLGPYFADGTGVLVISRSQLQLSAAADLDSGLMDYGRLEDCNSAIEVRVWSADDVRRALSARQHTWTMEFAGEAELYGSLAALIRKYESAPNSRLRLPVCLRDHWTDPETTKEYEVVLDLTE